MAQTGGLWAFELPHYLVLILKQHTSGVKASFPQGSQSFVSLASSDVALVFAKQQIVVALALAFIRDRHKLFVNCLVEQLLTRFSPVAEPIVPATAAKNDVLNACVGFKSDTPIIVEGEVRRVVSGSLI